jgi:dTDP-glucose 4,6-dehydratase/UDP-glucose 4-epimerase
LEIFRGKTIFITGGTGFFGVWMLSALAAIKHRLDGDMRIVALSRDPHRFLARHPLSELDLNVEFIRGDVKDFLIGDVRPDHLIHMATTNAEETFAGEDQLKKLETLYQGTKNVLEQCGPALKKVLFTSSGVAYGNNNGGVFSESYSTAPDTRDAGSALGIGKLTAEYLVAYYAKKFGYTYSVARCFAFAGQFEALAAVHAGRPSPSALPAADHQHGLPAPAVRSAITFSKGRRSDQAGSSASAPPADCHRR